MSGLCSLADVKTWLGLTTTTNDAKLQLFIDTVSEQMISYLGYQAKRTTYATERHAINNNQLMYLNAAPIQTVSAVTIAGVTISAGTNDDNYQYDPCDAKAGRLYKGTGWCGNYYTRNMTYDPVGGKRDIVVSYDAGWYFPDDALYVKGADASLPYAISSACMQETITKYRRAMSRAEGLVSYSEGGISWGWGNPKTSMESLDGAGLSNTCREVLNAFRRWGVA
jgi:hypothetical protein